jgi:hypothetical protein
VTREGGPPIPGTQGDAKDQKRRPDQDFERSNLEIAQEVVVKNPLDEILLVADQTWKKNL